MSRIYRPGHCTQEDRCQAATQQEVQSHCMNHVFPKMEHLNVYQSQPALAPRGGPASSTQAKVVPPPIGSCFVIIRSKVDCFGGENSHVWCVARAMRCSACLTSGFGGNGTELKHDQRSRAYIRESRATYSHATWLIARHTCGSIVCKDPTLESQSLNSDLLSLLTWPFKVLPKEVKVL